MADGAPSTATAKKLLETSRVHIECLMGVGMHGEAVATGAATLATIIVCRINPEDMAGMYLSYLQGLYLMSLPLASEPSGDEETQNHLITVAMQLGALSDISYKGLEQVVRVRFYFDRNVFDYFESVAFKSYSHVATAANSYTKPWK